MTITLGVCAPLLACFAFPTSRVAALELSSLSRKTRLQRLHVCQARTAVAALRSDWKPKNVAIVGGGLAGLSTAFHLLEQAEKDGAHGGHLNITIFDKEASAGTGGASAVAGGYVSEKLCHKDFVHEN